jgi:hypothetical protein
MIVELPVTNAATIPLLKSEAAINPPPVRNPAVIVAPAVIKAAMIRAISKVKTIGSPLEEFPFNPVTEGADVVAMGCVGNTLGVFRTLDVVGDGLAGFATLPTHLVTNGVTNTIVTSNITKNCRTIG